MPTTIVNARVDADDKRAADQVLASSHRTWSQAIQALAATMARTQRYPEALAQTDEAEQRERQRRFDILLSTSGISKSPELATDQRIAQILFDETTVRHG